MVYATKGRELKKLDMAQLWTCRVTAGAESHGLTYQQFSDGLIKNNILLNRKSLADLAIWEPRTFESLAKISADTLAAEKKNE